EAVAWVAPCSAPLGHTTLVVDHVDGELGADQVGLRAAGKRLGFVEDHSNLELPALGRRRGCGQQQGERAGTGGVQKCASLSLLRTLFRRATRRACESAGARERLSTRAWRWAHQPLTRSPVLVAYPLRSGTLASTVRARLPARLARRGGTPAS